jgi:hypothetical protein
MGSLPQCKPKQFQQKREAVLRAELRENTEQFQQNCAAVLRPELRETKT